MLYLRDLALRRGTRLLFSGASFNLHPGQKAGVTGVNGSGKSSLFSLILRQLQPDQGECHVPEDWVIAYVEQETLLSKLPAIEYVLDGDQRLRTVEAELATAEEKQDGVRMAELHERLAVIDGYAARSRGAQLLDGLGFSPNRIEDPVTTFSGGWRMRLNLGRALMCQSDLLLLDEPTNHLDLDAIVWLEQWLRSYQGTLLMVSHDRDFLDSTVDHILHIEAGSVKLYRGNYAAFEKRRAEHLSHEQAQYVRQKRQIEHMESFISRFRYKATKARQAQSRLKALERMTRIIPAHVDSVFRFSFHPPEKLPATLVTLENSAVGYGNTRVLDKVNLRLSPGDRIGLLGSNGAGKSTLVKLLAGDLDLISGDRIEGGDVEIGYFAQWQLDQLEPGMSPVQHLLQIDPKGGEQKLRDYLGGFGFSNEQALAPVEHFSGGEKSRLVLALVIYRRPNLLLLDEPTNHLDIEMRQALASALQEFTGAMVLVSHDRHLLRVSCDELLLVDNGRVEQYDQSLDEYADWLGRRKQLQNAAGEHVVNPNPAATVDRRQKRQIEAEMRQRLQPFTRVITRAESEMEQLHKERKDLESALSNNSLYGETQKVRLKEMLLKKTEIDRSLEKVEAEWLAASEKSEALRKPG